MVSLKVIYGREARRSSLASTNISFAEFKAKVVGLFEEEVPGDKAVLRYQDKDNDYVTVSSDEGLLEAFRQFAEKDGDTARFYLSVKGERAGGWVSGGYPHRSAGGRGCPLLDCPAMCGKDGRRCPLLSCPAMYGQGGKRGGCPLFNKTGYGGCPLFNKSLFGRRSSCPFLSCPALFGGGYRQYGSCPFFSRHRYGGGCPLFSGYPQFGGYGRGCPFLACPAVTRPRHSYGDWSSGDEEHHGCPFFACPTMKGAHEKFYHHDSAEEHEEEHEGDDEGEHAHDDDHHDDRHHHGHHGHHGGHHGWGWGWGPGRPHGWRRGHGWGGYGPHGHWGHKSDRKEHPKDE